MSKVFYIASMLSSAVQYNRYGPAVEGGSAPIVGSVVIKGGAGIADKNFQTPEGAVLTAVSAEELETVQQCPVFKLHEKNGFVKVYDGKIDPEVAAAVMAGRDASAPTVEADYEAQGVKPPIVNKDVSDDTDKAAPRAKK